MFELDTILDSFWRAALDLDWWVWALFLSIPLIKLHRKIRKRLRGK